MPNAEEVHNLPRTGITYSANESVLYSRDLLKALAAMALEHGQHRLAQLLTEAKQEADRLSEQATPHLRK